MQRRENHRKRILKSFKNQPKKFYGYMRNLQTVKDQVTVLKKPDGMTTTSDQEVADLFAEYFQEVYTVEDLSNIPTVPERDCTWNDTICFSKELVYDKQQMLKTDKSPGPDGLHPMLLKECAASIAGPLSQIFQLSYDTGTLPEEWRIAHVVPIFKKGDRTNRENYRPVSLTSIPCKVMESIIKDTLIKHLEANELLCKQQHGFRRGRSCLTNLLETLESWTQALDNGYGLDVVYLDYRKAFDSVPHQRLLEKLKDFGIKGKLRRWLEGFLVSRKITVGVRGAFSQLLAVLSGVPQGSVIGPLLFLLFVNELPMWIINELRMFADDTKLWCPITTIADSITLQQDLDTLCSWSEKWQLRFNADKCKVMHIGHSLPTGYYMTVGTNKTVLQSVQEEKDLGVVVLYRVLFVLLPVCRAEKVRIKN